MRVLVTGATGFLGGRLCHVLHQAGFDVVGTGRDAARAPGVGDFVATDLSRSLDNLPTVEAIVHCAALSSPWGARVDFEAANVMATENLVQWAENQGCRRFVHISTPALYFQKFDQFGVREDQALGKPINHYAATKAAAEALVQSSSLSTLIFRPRAIYGLGDRALLPRLLSAMEAGPLPLLRDGRAMTDLTHVDDLCAAILAGLKSDVRGIFNIAGPEPVQLKSLIEQLAERSGQRLRWRALPLPVLEVAAQGLEGLYRVLPLEGEPRFTAYTVGIFAYSLTLDTSLARQALHWQPKVTLEQGLDQVFPSSAKQGSPA